MDAKLKLTSYLHRRILLTRLFWRHVLDGSELDGPLKDKQISSLILALLDNNTANFWLRWSFKDNIDVFKRFGAIFQF